jgi:phosphatidylserine decarboxylase
MTIHNLAEYYTSNCFFALKCVSHVRPTSEDLTVVAYSCINAEIMLHPRICCNCIKQTLMNQYTALHTHTHTHTKKEKKKERKTG